MIQGNKITLRALESEDLQKMHKWANDPDLTQFVGPRLPVSIADQQLWFEQLRKKESRRALIIQVKEQEPIGYMYLDIDWINRKAELSTAIGEKGYQDKGYGSDAVQTALNHCFNELNLNKVYLYVFEFNLRAVRLYEKCGLKKEGLIRQDYLIHGKYENRIIMGILKTEFNVNRDG